MTASKTSETASPGPGHRTDPIQEVIRGSALRVAVVGVGMAGATCARLLSDAGCAVSVFDKSRGVGGRMATRRAEWLDDTGTPQPARLDHGAPGFSAQSPEFAAFVAQLHTDGVLARWTPRLAPGSATAPDPEPLWVAQPDMPAVCRERLAGVPLHTLCPIDALQRGPQGWMLHSADLHVGQVFDVVVLAIPGAQAARLLQPHEPQWAERAAALPMQPCWTLMAVTDEPRTGEAFDLAWPRTGELACIVRNDAKPGRPRTPGLAQWVVHATRGFSETHLEAQASDVQARLQEALSRWLGQALTWHHVAVHRWRFASALPATTQAPDALQRCWWSDTLGLGVCGDALGGAGVEGAWVSGRALALAVMARWQLSPRTVIAGGAHA